MRRRGEEISKTAPGRGPGRREEEEDVKIGPDWPWPPEPPLLTKECRCPYCGYSEVFESGTRCNLMDCPICGNRMRG